jgi:hypothetical protein
MRILMSLWIVSLVACSVPGPIEPVRPALLKSVESQPVIPIPVKPMLSPRVTLGEIRGIRFEGIVFDSRSHRLVVADQARGPGSQYPDSAAAARAYGGIAAMNAGFFTPEGSPLGLIVSGGEKAGAWNSASSLGSGLWHQDWGNRSGITRRELLGRTTAASMRELIQAGPLLVEHSQLIGGLESTKSSVRSVILWDGLSSWWLGRTSPCTLAALGSALATGSPTDWRVRDALNLDGGRSTDLWISATADGGPILRRAPWNRPVRNFLVLVKR